jgi:hypothetical protein
MEKAESEVSPPLAGSMLAIFGLAAMDVSLDIAKLHK